MLVQLKYNEGSAASLQVHGELWSKARYPAVEAVRHLAVYTSLI